MGGIGEMFGSVAADQGTQYGMQGLAIGMQTGAGIANAMYNEAAMRESAKAVGAQSDLQAYLIREQYLAEYKALQFEQEKQQSQNRVDQVKYGIRGASANAVMQSYAAKAQENLNTLYYNAAMATGKQSIAAMTQKAALLERARQYDWQATQKAISGVVNFGSGMLNTWSRLNKPTTDVDPTAALTSGTPNPEVVAIANGDWKKLSDFDMVRNEIIQSGNIDLGHN